MSSPPIRYGKQSSCTNCGIHGHHFRNCTAPVTSYGIIACRTPHQSSDPILYNLPHSIDNPSTHIEVLMIQRRDSIGYVELIRAKYKLTDIDYISQQIRGTTTQERQKLETQSFQDLWIGLWGSHSGETRQYKQEYEQALSKFTTLREGFEHEGLRYSLSSFCTTYPVQWETPEWGFPKGRRNPGESDMACAKREFFEETNVTDTHVRFIDNIEPLEEMFFGNNGIHYCHRYYFAWVHPSVHVELVPQNVLMSREVGGIGWFTIDQASQQIRDVNIEKRALVARISTVLQTLCPILIGCTLTTQAEQPPHTEGSSTNRRLAHEQRAWQQLSVRGERVRQHTTESNSSARSGDCSTAVGRSSQRGTYSFVDDTQ